MALSGILILLMLYKNTKVKIRSPDGDYFSIVVGVLQRDTLAPYLFIICLDCVLRTSPDEMKYNGFKPVKERNRRYPAQTITDADYADDIALLANTPTQAKPLLQSPKRAVADIGLHVNADKAEYMFFNQRGVISTLNGISETSGQVHLPWKQCLINWGRHQNATSKGMDSYWSAIYDIKSFFSKPRSCRYYCMDELHGR